MPTASFAYPAIQEVFFKSLLIFRSSISSMLMRFYQTLSIASIISSAAADTLSLTGTWTTKSNQVFTGPGFYDPVDELLIEPGLPGRSYSFTDDGHYEAALYVVNSNAKDHGCPTAVLQFSHGTFTEDDGRIELQPIAEDGRQLLSDPCADNGVSTYSRFSGNGSFTKYVLDIDSYSGRYRLKLYDFDGTPLPPLYLAYKPPLMLPTETLNPTSSASATGTSKRSIIKRSLENKRKTNAVRMEADFSRYWYAGLGLFSLGGLSYVFL